jgi:predicted nucleotidyltransferase
MDSEWSLSRIKDMLRQVLTGCEVYQFGSRATGRYRDVSDIDMGVLAPRDISREHSIAREMLVESDIPFTVDLVDLSATSREFVEEVQRESILVWKD